MQTKSSASRKASTCSAQRLISSAFCKPVKFQYKIVKYALLLIALYSTGFANEPYNLHLNRSNPDKPEKVSLIGIQYGGNGGMYFANRTTANYYNGQRVPTNGYSLDSTDISRILFNPYSYKQIKEAVGNYDYKMGEYPAKMKYTPALCFGIFVKYQFDENLGFFTQFNYTKLHADDVFTLVLNEYNGSTQPYYYEANISGTESRVNIDLGANYLFKKEGQRMYPYAEMGLNINNVTVKNYEIKIGTQQYNIMNPYNVQYNVKEGGIGFGGLASLGYQVEFNKKTILNIGLTSYVSRINLGESQHFALNNMIQFRIIFINFGSQTEPK